MKPKLLKSFIFVVVFWFIITTLYWSIQSDTSIALNAVSNMDRFIPNFLKQDHQFSGSILSAMYVQWYVLKYWTFPVLIVGTISFIIGFLALWRKAIVMIQERSDREKGTGQFRGVSLTLGVLPLPFKFNSSAIELDATSEDSPFKAIQQSHLDLLSQVLGVLMEHESAYSGETASNFDLAVEAVSKALSHKMPGLAAIVAASSFLGNITYWSKKEGSAEWSPSLTKSKDGESAKILSSLEAWFNLPAVEKNAILMAVRFKSTPKSIPMVSSNEESFKMAKELLFFTGAVEKQVVSENRQKTLDNENIPDLILDTFLKSLPLLSFQHKGLPKGVQAVAWKIGKRVFMLEIKLRETMLSKLTPELRNTLTATPSGKEKVRVQPFTSELLKALQEKGWLVTEIDGLRVNPKEALWNVKAGKLEFKGVIILDIPDHLISQLPPGDSMYDVTVSGTLFSVPSNNQNNNHASGSISKAELGGILNSPPLDSSPKP